MQRFGKSEKNIVISFSIVIFLVILLGAIATFKMMILSHLTQRFYNHPFTVTTATHNIQAHLISIHRYMKDVVLSKNEEEIELALKKVANDEKIIYHELDRISKRYLGNAEEISQTRKMFSDWKPIQADVVRLMKENKRDEAIVMNKTVAYEHVKSLNKKVAGMIDFAHNKADEFKANALDIKKITISVIILLTILIMIFIVLIMLFLLKKLKKMEAERQKHEEKLFQQSHLIQMGEMVSMIAHQWRQPLASIAAIVSSMQIKQAMGNYDEDSMGKELENIAEVTQHLSGTIDDFRNFYKPNKEQVYTKLENVVLESINIMQASFKSNHIKIIQKYECSERIEIHKNEMVQVVMNLLKNACDNFQEKEIADPTIKITVTNETIAVCDNGGGIPQAIISRIFEPYFSTKSERNGTGLGLYMSKTIVEEHHGGRLEVENKDAGVCFKIILDQAA